MKKWEIGLSSGHYSKLTQEVFDAYSAAGIKYMEFCLRHIRDLENPDIKTEAYTCHNADDLKQMSERSGVKLWSLHVPYGEFYDLSVTDDAERAYAVKKYGELIRYTGEIGAKITVVHPSFEPIEESQRAERLRCTADSLAKLADTAAACGVTVAVENLPRTCLGRDGKEMQYLLTADDRLGLCFDVNHLLIQSHKDFMGDIGGRIVTVHISDYDFVDERHLLPGKGKIDWAELILLLKQAGYSGPFMNELNWKSVQEKNESDPHGEVFRVNQNLLDKYF